MMLSPPFSLFFFLFISLLCSTVATQNNLVLLLLLFFFLSLNRHGILPDERPLCACVCCFRAALNAAGAQRGCGWGRLSSFTADPSGQQVGLWHEMGSSSSKLHFRKAVIQLTTKTQVSVRHGQRQVDASPAWIFKKKKKWSRWQLELVSDGTNWATVQPVDLTDEFHTKSWNAQIFVWTFG